MADARRETGPIDARPSTLGLLAALRARAGVSARAELQLQDLADVEMAFATRFSQDLLAVWAAGVPVLAQTHHMRVTSVVGMTAALLERKARGDLVCVGRDGELFLCVEKRQTQPGCTLLLVDPDASITTSTTLDAWLEAQLEAMPGAANQTTVEATPGPFAPRIVRPLPASASGTRVRHAKFGEGNVLREIGTGPLRKLQVDFPKFGLKMLQARFVEYID